MKKLIRAVTLVLLVGGWSVAGLAVHVVRTPSNFVVVPKERLNLHDTYVDTRKWTLADDQAHPSVVAGVLHMGRSDLLKHTLPTTVVDAQTTLEAAAAQPQTGAAGAGLVDQATGQLKSVVTLVKQKL